METPAAAATNDKANASFWHKHWQKVLAASFWLLLIGAYLFYTLSRGVSPLSLQALRPLLGFLGESRRGPFIFIGLYVLRPLVLFSSVVLTLAAGALFGPVWGVIYTIIGANLGSSLAYFIGRTFGGDMNIDKNAKGIGKYVERMRENSFETVFIMRLIYIPYDLVTYLAGFLKINYGAFILATVLGALPGTISVALLGASAGLDGGKPSFDPRVLLVSVGLFVVSFGVSRLIKRSEKNNQEKSKGAEHA